ncbi:MAG: hypothetical protein WBX11_14315 [Thiobacillaceae bacterium]
MRPLNVISCTTTALLLFAFGEYAFAISSDYSDSIKLAVNRWLAVQKPSGLLPYGFDFLENEESEPNTLSAANLTRQTGTAAVLADYYTLTNDQRARPAIRQFIQAFGRYSLPIGKSRVQALVERAHLLSMPFGRYKIQATLNRFGLLYETEGAGKVLSPSGDYSKAYAGTVALALLTELRYSQTSGDNSFANLRHAWLEGLIGLRIPGDGFRQFPTSIDTTPYYDGEAWLALAQYHRAFPQDQHVSELLTDVDDALIEKYRGEFKIAFFSWGAMVAAARFADTKERKFLDFIKAQTSTFLDRKKDHVDNDNTCASVEGVADALGSLLNAGEGGSELATRAREWVATEMRKVKQLQIQPGQKELIFSTARIIAPRMQEFTGSFRGGVYAANTQVDLTAHCVSAMVKLTRYSGMSSGN